MRVLHVIDGLGTGGAERSLAEILPHLDQAGIESTLWALHRRGRGVEPGLLAAGYDVRFAASAHLAGRVVELRRVVRERAPDVVHTCLFSANLAGRLAVAGRVPVLTSLVNTSYDRVRRRDPNVRGSSLTLVRAVDLATWRLTTHFHAITRAVAEAAQEALGIPAARITMIERGRDTARLGEPSPARRHRARAALEVPAGAPLVVTAGRQDYQKGQDVLLEAAAELRHRVPGLVVFVCGRDGGATAALRTQVERLRLGDTVRFLGHRDDLPEILAAADIFAFPSRYEGLGGVLLEAMALALPIVASDIPAVRETVDEGCNAVLVPPGHPEPLAAALADLLADPGRRGAFGAHSRRRFLEHYAMDVIARRMVGLYESVASG